MSKRDYIIRYLLIIKKLRNSRYATFVDINNYIQREFELIDTSVSVSLRTFQRDLSEIRSIFNVDIRCNNSNQYYINEDEYSEFNNRMLESFDLINTFNSNQQLTPYIELEKRCALGTEHLYGLIHAIRNKLTLNIVYQAYYHTEEITREVEPYVLKEFKGRWYVLLKDCSDNAIKTYGIDRIHEIEVTKKKFNFSQNFNPKEYFRNSFGIYKSNELEPVEILISFEALQGKYIKSYPLHTSQKVLIDNETELCISLFVCESPDLIVEILSFGAKAKVIQPQSLVNKVIDTIQCMNKVYNI